MKIEAEEVHVGVLEPRVPGNHTGQRVGPVAAVRPPREQLLPDHRDRGLDADAVDAIPEIIEAGGASLFPRLCGNPSATCPGERVGNVGRNALRADGIGNIDFSFTKNTRFGGQNLQVRVEMFNATNTRNFGIPEGQASSTSFLNQWGADGGARRIWVAMRYSFSGRLEPPPSSLP